MEGWGWGSISLVTNLVDRFYINMFGYPDLIINSPITVEQESTKIEIYPVKYIFLSSFLNIFW
jgi:hypothetical protein